MGRISSLKIIDLRDNLLTQLVDDRLFQALQDNNVPVWKALTHLDMSDNRAAGPIPPSLFPPSATSLSSVRLQRNLLTGTIPKSIANAVNLRELWLMDNALEALPNSVSQLWELESLFLQVL